MKNRYVVIALVLLGAAVLLIAFRPLLLKKAPARAAKATAPAKTEAVKKAVKTPAVKPITKGRGALTVKMTDTKGKAVSLNVRAFRSEASRPAIYETMFKANVTQELVPGTYDLVIDTLPASIHKGIRVDEGKENIHNLGTVTGNLTVKTLNSQKAATSYALVITASKSGNPVVSVSTNRAVDIMPGSYDIDIGTMPKLVKRDIRVEAAREAVLDLGCVTGALLVKAIDENGADVRQGVTISKADSKEAVAKGQTGKTIELLPGTYAVEIMTTPRQAKKEIAVVAGERVAVDYIVSSLKPAPAAPKQKK